MSYVHNSLWHEGRLERQWPGDANDSDRIATSVDIWKRMGATHFEKIPVERIVSVICEVYKVFKDDIIGPRRSLYLMYPRYHAIALTIDLRPDLSLTTIARLFNRDHSTIIHARNAWHTTRWEQKTAQIAVVNSILFKDAEPMVG